MSQAIRASRARRCRTLFPRRGRRARRSTVALEALCRRASQAVHDGCTILVLSDRGVDADWAPIPSLLAICGRAPPPHPRRPAHARSASSSRSGDAREVSHFALLIGYGAGAVNPYLALETLAELARPGSLPTGRRRRRRRRSYVKARREGPAQDHVEDGDLHARRATAARRSSRRSASSTTLVERYFTGTPSRIGGIGHRRRSPRRRCAAIRAAFDDRACHDASRRRAATTTTASRASTTTGTRCTIATLQHATRDERR